MESVAIPIWETRLGRQGVASLYFYIGWGGLESKNLADFTIRFSMESVANPIRGSVLGGSGPISSHFLAFQAWTRFRRSGGFRLRN